MRALRTAGDLAARALTVARDMPGAIISHSTAAWLWGFDILPPGVGEHDWDVDILATPALPLPDIHGVRVHRGEPSPDDVLSRHGVLLTDVFRTAVDCVCTLSRYQALAALDAFARAGISQEHIRRRFNTLPAGLAGRRQAGELLPLADSRVESPGESWARLLIFDAGMPMPEPQVPVPYSGGNFYLDLAFVRYRTAVEYDGEEHHTTLADLRHDRRRRALIRSAGWELVVAQHHEVRAMPHLFLRSVYETLLIQSWRPPDARRLEIERNIRQIAAHARLNHGLR